MDNQGFFAAETRKFEKKTGIEVELVNMSWENVADKVEAEMAANSSTFDVIELDNSWVAKFATNQWIEPLDDYITTEMKEGIMTGTMNKFIYDGHLYGIPWNNDTRFFMYNKSKLDQAGIKLPPRTWDELKEQSQIMMDKGIVKYGFADSYMHGQGVMNQLSYLVYSFGGDFVNESGNLTITSDPAVEEAYKFLKNGINEDKFIDPASTISDYETVAGIFLNGDTAFFPQAWAGVYKTANDPDKSKIVDQIAVAPFAIGVNENTQAVLTLPEAMAIPKNSKHKEAAWKYIQYMSSKEFDKRKAEKLGALPIWKELFIDKDLLKEYPHWKEFGTQSLSAKGLQDLLWYDQFANVVSTESLKIILDQKSVEQGLKDMEEQLKPLAK